MIRAEGADPERFKRILALTWAHAKPRRGVRTVDLEEEYHKGEDDDEDNSTVLDNIKKSEFSCYAGSAGLADGASERCHTCRLRPDRNVGR